MFFHIPQFMIQLGHEKYLMILGVIIPVWTVIVIILERFFPYTKGIKLFRRGFWIDLIWYTFIQSKVLEVVIFTYIILGLKSYLGFENFGPLSHLNFWVLLFIFFISHDFYIYWFHRLQHNNKFLWRTHEGHHSGRDVDWLAGSRSHFLEILINQTIEFLPIFFFLDSQTALFMVPTKALLDALWGIWIHSNINVNTGRLQYIINGPEMHQWHHANHYEVFYKNYGTKLAVWDWLFDTGFLPNLKPLNFYFTKPKMYGLPYAYPKGFFPQTIFALKRFNFHFLEEKSIYNKILNFRVNFITFIASIFKVKKEWITNEIFDKGNSNYKLDDLDQKCIKCGNVQKYFYQEFYQIFTCEICESNENLNKFN